MPQWGRPSGARIGRSKRGLVRRLEDSVREKGLAGDDNDDDDDDDEEEQEGVFLDSPRGRQRLLQQEHHTITGSDGEADSDDGEEYGLHTAYSDPTIAYAMQLAMKDDDEWIVENALEKIRRAQRLGKPGIKLSKRELDALERSRLQSEHWKPNSMASSRRPSAASSPQFQRRTSDAASYVSARPPSTSQQARPRTPSIQSMHPPNSNYYPPPYAQGLNYAMPPESPTFRPPSSASTRIQQPIPEDPQWNPRSRASSNAYMSQPPYPPYIPTSFISYDPHYATSVHHPAFAPPFDNPYQQQMYRTPSDGAPMPQPVSDPVTPQPAQPTEGSPKTTNRPNSSGSSSDNGVRVNSTPADTSASPAGSDKKKEKKKQPAKATTNGSAARVGRRKRKPSVR